MVEDVVYAWIGCHGISDVSFPVHLWCPLYAASCAFAGLMPYAGTQVAVLSLTALHFSHDATAELVDAPVLLVYTTVLGTLLLRRRERLAQRAIVGYLACVHTPLHMWSHATRDTSAHMAMLFAVLLSSRLYQNTMRGVVERGAINRDCWLNRGLLGVTGGHLASHVCRRVHAE